MLISMHYLFKLNFKFIYYLLKSSLDIFLFIFLKDIVNLLPHKSPNLTDFFTSLNLPIIKSLGNLFTDFNRFSIGTLKDVTY